MAIVINGSGTVTGISVGGLPDNIVDAGTLADDAVGLAQMASGTDGNVITYDTSGNPAVVATGTAGHFLKSAGADAVPTFAAGSGNTPSVRGRLSGDQSFSAATWTKINWDTEDWDTDSAFASYKFTVPSGEGGKYEISWTVCISGAADDEYGTVKVYKNGSADDTTRSVTPGSQNIGEYFTGNTVQLSLAATDYIELYGMANGAGNFLYTRSSFSIHKLAGA